MYLTTPRVCLLLHPYAPGRRSAEIRSQTRRTMEHLVCELYETFPWQALDDQIFLGTLWMTMALENVALNKSRWRPLFPTTAGDGRLNSCRRHICRNPSPREAICGTLICCKSQPPFFLTHKHYRQTSWMLLRRQIRIKLP